ncbi:LCP family protein [Streptomyces sp. N2-109]|uniref:LCP family protein n=1 Tax=Streptomyces gossypii TaxID=2883101 RepID=A0ABT2JUU9_9ACTN|nr:LCP family protein [Streptomyces gossypii]MCT2591673.1 LCP family protein [Streptomyces gossypii]
MSADSPAGARRSDRRPPRRSRRHRALVVGAVCLTLAGGAALGAGTARLPVALAVPRTEVFGGMEGMGKRPADGPGINFLLVGLDRRAGMSDAEKDRLHVNGEQCDCTDTMMLLHVSADRRRVSTVSIPRDSYVPFPRSSAVGNGGGKPVPVPRAGKINGAYKLGGPALTVRTVEAATGVRVDNYLEADFSGFVAAVDRLGGATVCTDVRMRDKNAGLDLAPGTHHLDGRGALRYVRARHIPPSGDLGRVRRQQALIAGMLDQLHDRGVFQNPLALARTAHALLDTLRADEHLTTARLRTLGRAMRGLNSRNTEFATVPIADFDHRVTDWGSTLKWDGPRAERLFAALREDRTLTSEQAYALPAPGVPVSWPPGDIELRVRALPGRERAAAELERGLRANGFRVLGRLPAHAAGAGGAGDAARTPHTRTRVRYDPYWERQATTLAAALPEAELRPVRGHSRVFEVLPGSGRPQVARIVHDRSSVQGAPATGDELACEAG